MISTPQQNGNTIVGSIRLQDYIARINSNFYNKIQKNAETETTDETSNNRISSLKITERIELIQEGLQMSKRGLSKNDNNNASTKKSNKANVQNPHSPSHFEKRKQNDNDDNNKNKPDPDSKFYHDSVYYLDPEDQEGQQKENGQNKENNNDYDNDNDKNNNDKPSPDSIFYHEEKFYLDPEDQEAAREKAHEESEKAAKKEHQIQQFVDKTNARKKEQLLQENEQKQRLQKAMAELERESKKLQEINSNLQTLKRQKQLAAAEENARPSSAIHDEPIDDEGSKESLDDKIKKLDNKRFQQESLILDISMAIQDQQKLNQDITQSPNDIRRLYPDIFSSPSATEDAIPDRATLEKQMMLSSNKNKNKKQLSPSGKQIVLLTAHDGNGNNQEIPGINEMAEQNRIEYSNLHGYTHQYVNLSSEFPKYLLRVHPVWGKLKAIKKAFDDNPEAEWVWWLDLDMIILNPYVDLASHLLNPEVLAKRLSYGRPVHFPNPGKDGYANVYTPFNADTITSSSSSKTNKKGLKNSLLSSLPINKPYNAKINPFPNQIETLDPKKVGSQIDIIVALDRSGINAGSFFVRRSEFTTMLLDYWADPAFINNGNFGLREQDTLSHMSVFHPAMHKHIGVVPQRLINADGFDYYYSSWDTGDLCVHFAGCWVDRQCGTQWNKFWKVRDRVPPAFRVPNAIV